MKSPAVDKNQRAPGYAKSRGGQRSRQNHGRRGLHVGLLRLLRGAGRRGSGESGTTKTDPTPYPPTSWEQTSRRSTCSPRSCLPHVRNHWPRSIPGKRFLAASAALFAAQRFLVAAIIRFMPSAQVGIAVGGKPIGGEAKGTRT